MTENPLVPATERKTSLTPSVKKSSPGSGPSFLASNVTRENFVTKAKDFMKVNGDGFLIALRQGAIQGVDYEETLVQWGAWRAYFLERKINVKFMDRQGQDGKCYTVPAEWPHLFDADATVQADYQAGDYFIATRKPERQYNLDATVRRAAVATRLGYNPAMRDRNPTLPAEQPAGPSQEYLDALLASHDAGMEEAVRRKGERHAPPASDNPPH